MLLIKVFEVSQRRACTVAGQPRTPQRKGAPAPGRCGATPTFPVAPFGWGQFAIWISAPACVVGQVRGIRSITRACNDCAEMKAYDLRIQKRKTIPVLGDQRFLVIAQRSAFPNYPWALDFQFNQTRDARERFARSVPVHRNQSSLHRTSDRHGKTPTWNHLSHKSAMSYSPLKSSATLLEAKIMAEDFRQHYNQHRPHSTLEYQTSVEFT